MSILAVYVYSVEAYSCQNNDQEVKISQFADDTAIITSNENSLKSHLQVIDWFRT